LGRRYWSPASFRPLGAGAGVGLGTIRPRP
jgi:hypothetical protein